MRISRQQVQHVAELSRIQLSEQEEELFLSQLGRILSYVEKLNELNTDDVDMAFHTWDLQNVFREDIRRESLPRGAALANAPERTGKAYKVPRVIE